MGARLRHPASSRVVQRRRTMSSSFYADVFKVHHHSTISFGVPTFIPFVLPVLACSVLPYKFIYHFDKYSAQKWFVQ